MATPNKRIRLASFCTETQVEKSSGFKGIYQNKAAKSIFLDLLKEYWLGSSTTIKVPLEDFAHVVWMTYLLRTPTNKGNVKRDKRGNRVVDTEAKKCIHNTEASHFVSLSDNEKETRCMHIIKHLRKYFKIVDGKTEWSVTHPNFATAKALNEEVIENILPNRNAPAKKPSPSPSVCNTRSKRKRSHSEDEDESSATTENRKRRRRNSDSDVASSSYSDCASDVASSPDTSMYQAPDTPDLQQSPETNDNSTLGDFQSSFIPQTPVDLSWYSMMAHPSFYYPVYFPAFSSWE